MTTSWYHAKDSNETVLIASWKEILSKTLPAKVPTARKIFLGFDAFIDRIIHVVDKRQGPNTYAAITQISALSERIGRAAGKSANIELVELRSKLGGNSAIMAYSLACLGQEVHYAGTISNHSNTAIDPLFQPLVDKAHQAITLAPASISMALEFDDGKLILGLHENILKFSLKEILAHQSKQEWQKLFCQMEIVSFLNWTMTLEMNGMMRELLLDLPISQSLPKLFIDLADPAKRSDEDIRAFLALLKEATAKGFALILSVNESELIQLSDLIRGEKNFSGARWNNLYDRSKILAEELEVEIVVVHMLKCAFSFSPKTQTTHYVDGPFCQHPKLTTGGGDHFNAGLATGLLHAMPLPEAIALGCANSGYYVSHGASASWEELHAWVVDRGF